MDHHPSLKKPFTVTLQGKVSQLLTFTLSSQAAPISDSHFQTLYQICKSALEEAGLKTDLTIDTSYGTALAMYKSTSAATAAKAGKVQTQEEKDADKRADMHYAELVLRSLQERLNSYTEAGLAPQKAIEEVARQFSAPIPKFFDRISEQDHTSRGPHVKMQLSPVWHLSELRQHISNGVLESDLEVSQMKPFVDAVMHKIAGRTNAIMSNESNIQVIFAPQSISVLLDQTARDMFNDHRLALNIRDSVMEQVNKAVTAITGGQRSRG